MANPASGPGPDQASQMQACRLHIMGASGAGVTTLGRAVATALAVPHHDTDDYFWCPTVPPYQTPRSVDERLRLMREMFLPRHDWVLSGALDMWGDEVLRQVDMVVFVDVPTDVRLARLRVREARHFGADAVAPGGWRHAETEEFLAWAACYDDNSRRGRNRARHEAWLAGLTCPVLRLDGRRPIDVLAGEVVGRWRSLK